MRLNNRAISKNAILFLAAGLLAFFLADKFLADTVRGVEWLVKHRQMFAFRMLDELGRTKNWVSGAGMVLITSSFVLYLKKGDKYRQKWVRYSGYIFLSVFFASLVTGVLKTVAGRYRPYNVTPDSPITFYSFHPFQGDYNKLASFPSSHAAIVIAVCFALYFLSPKEKMNKYFFLLAFLIIAQRLLTLNHYLSDVIIGAGIGVLMAYLARWFWKNFIKIGE